MRRGVVDASSVSCVLRPHAVHVAVFDCGSDTTKVGVAGEEAPRAVFPTVACSGSGGEMLAGDSAVAQRGSVAGALRRPVQHGAVTDWDDMAALWQYAYEREMRLYPEDQPVLCVVPDLMPMDAKVKMAEVCWSSNRAALLQRSLFCCHARAACAGVV